MRSLVSFALLLFTALVSALSSAGNRLLVVVDNVEEKDAYSIFFTDLAGKKGVRHCVADALVFCL